MRSILKAIIITLCLLVKTYLSYSENTGTNINHILVLNAYSSSNPWSNSFITPIVNMASQNKQIGVYVENLNKKKSEKGYTFRSIFLLSQSYCTYRKCKLHPTR